MITKKNFKEIIVESNMLSLVQFKTEWSGASQILEMIYADLMKSYTGVVNFHTVDFEKEGSLVKEYGIREVPTILFFKQGKMVDYVIGMIPRNQLISKIENALSK